MNRFRHRINIMLDEMYNKLYPPTVLNRMRARKRNKNQHFSIVCGNCMGGYIYHQLDVQFQSPTINLLILQPDLYKFILNMDEYLSLDFHDAVECGSRGASEAKLKDITIHFGHYNSSQDGIDAWKRRIPRLDKDNLYIIATDADGITVEDIISLQKTKYKKMVVFTSKKLDLPYCFQVEEFKDDQCIGNIIDKDASGKWKFEKFFDYVGWLNSDDPVAEHFKI